MSSTIYSTIKTNKMTITIITERTRAEHIKEDARGHYTAELFEPKDKISADQLGVKLTFPDYFNADMAALIMFHVGVSYGLDKGIAISVPSFKPDRFKDISVDGRN